MPRLASHTWQFPFLFSLSFLFGGRNRSLRKGERNRELAITIRNQLFGPLVVQRINLVTITQTVIFPVAAATKCITSRSSSFRPAASAGRPFHGAFGTIPRSPLNIGVSW